MKTLSLLLSLSLACTAMAEAHGPALAFTPEQMKAHGIALATVRPAALTTALTFPGDLRLDDTRIAHVTPRVAAVVDAVAVAEGDVVRRGDVLARLTSREAADLIAEIRAAELRLCRTKALADEEAALLAREATTPREAREAKLAANEAEAELQGLRQRLAALKLTPDAAQPSALTLVAPMDGVVLRREATVGAAVPAEATLFTVADLSHLWADLRAEPERVAQVTPGQRVTLLPSGAEGTVRWVGPRVDETTRTVRLRVDVPNPKGALRPGSFIEGRLTLPGKTAPVAVENDAIQRDAHGDAIVFVRDDHGHFVAKEVELGAQDATHTEVLKGLKAGETYVSRGAFVLKAEQSKGAFGDGHNH